MAPVEWFYARDNQHKGPVSAAELKRLALAGQIRPDDLVWREGLADWLPASRVKGLLAAEDASPSGEAAGPSLVPVTSAPPRRGTRRPARHVFDTLLDLVRGAFPGPFVEATLKLFTLAGYYGLYAAMAVLVLYVLLVVVQNRQLDHVPRELLLLAALVILQYAARRFCAALDRLNRATPVAMASAAFLDCFALLNMVGGLAALVALTWLAVQTGLFFLVAPAVAAFILGQSAAVMAVHPQTLQVEITPRATAGQELIGVLSFLVKFGSRITPVAFGVGVVCGTVVLGYACILTVFPPSEPPSLRAPGGADVFSKLLESTGDLPIPLPGQINEAVQGTPAEQAARRGETILLVSSALPVLMYFLFLSYYLLLDLFQAILAVPGKLDRLGGIPEQPGRESPAPQDRAGSSTGGK